MNQFIILFFRNDRNIPLSIVGAVSSPTHMRLDLLGERTRCSTHAYTSTGARNPRTHACGEGDKARERLKIASEKFKYAKSERVLFLVCSRPHKRERGGKNGGGLPALGALPPWKRSQLSYRSGVRVWVDRGGKAPLAAPGYGFSRSFFTSVESLPAR